MRSISIVLVIVACELMTRVGKIDAQGIFGGFANLFRRSTSKPIIQTFTAYGPPQTLYITQTETESLYFTDTVTQIETTTETEWFSWVRWTTETETLRMTQTLTSTSTTVDVSLLVSVAVVTLTEKTTKTAFSTITATDTSTLTTTLFFDRTIWSAQTMNSCPTSIRHNAPMAPELRSNPDDDDDIDYTEFLQPTATLLKVESSEIPPYAVKRMNQLESSFNPANGRQHRLSDPTEYPIMSSMPSAEHDSDVNEYY